MKHIIYGNYFLGLCALALSIEAILQQNLPVNGIFYYIFIFLSTIVYYTYAYTTLHKINNDRDNWYFKNKRFIAFTQRFYTFLCVVLFLIFIFKNKDPIFQLSLREYTFIGIFPFLAFLYYGINFPPFLSFNLRNIGLLKPVLIGFIWSGIVTLYPLFYFQLTHHMSLQIPYISVILFTNNFMFALVLSILFDIKDYADDANRALKTLIVRIGLRKTIHYILLPLCLAGLAFYWEYALHHNFPFIKILFLSLPYILLLVTVFSLKKRQSLWYYLTVVDGLFLLKAVCGILVSVCF